MSFLVILFALVARQSHWLQEPSAMLSDLARRWRDGWLERTRSEGWGKTATLLFVILPPTLLVFAISMALSTILHGVWAGLLALVVMLIVLLDQTRPGTLKKEQDAWLKADEQHQELLKRVDFSLIQEAANEDFQRARKALLIEQLRELFAPVFWFLVLGPAAAIAYYFLRLAHEKESLAESGVEMLLYYADWPVVRILTASFALAGDFSEAWQQWRELIMKKGVTTEDFLDQCAANAQLVKLVEAEDTHPGAVLGEALRVVGALLSRVLVLWVVLLALHTLWP